MGKSKVVSAVKVNNETVYAVETTAGTYIADGVYHHNCKYHCNKWKSGNIEKYKIELDLKYGNGTKDKLDMAAAVNRGYSLKKDELQLVIDSSTSALNFYIDSAKLDMETIGSGMIKSAK